LNDIWQEDSGEIYLTGDGTVTIVSGIGGKGNIYKTNAGVLALESDNSLYEGNFYQTAGRTEVFNQFFRHGVKQFTGGILKTITEVVYDLRDTALLAPEYAHKDSSAPGVVTFDNPLDYFAKEAKLELADTTHFNIDAGLAQLDNSDEWSGTITLGRGSEGVLTLENVNKDLAAAKDGSGGDLQAFGGTTALLAGSFTVDAYDKIDENARVVIESGADLIVDNATGATRGGGNIVLGSETIQRGDIHVADNGHVIFKNTNGNNITGKFFIHGSEVEIVGDMTPHTGWSTYTLNNGSVVSGGDINIYDVSTLKVNAGAIIDKTHPSHTSDLNLSMNEGTIDSINGTIQNFILDSFNPGYKHFTDIPATPGFGYANFRVNVNALALTADKYTFDVFTPAAGTQITVDKFWLINDFVNDKNEWAVQVFEDTTASNNTIEIGDYSGINFNAPADGRAESAIAWYNVRSLEAEDFVGTFAGGESTGTGDNWGGWYGLTFDRYKPSAFAAGAAAIVTVQNQYIVNSMLFDNANVVPGNIATSYNNKRNMYAINDTENNLARGYTQEQTGLWFRPMTVLETVHLQRGINVKNTVYNALIGGDFEPVDLKRGWTLFPMAYMGYTGAHQSYSDVRMSQNGGQGGLMATLAKNDFRTSIMGYGGVFNNTLTGGSLHGSDNHWMGGGAVKTAYNFHPGRGEHFTIQPNAMFTYNVYSGYDFKSHGYRYKTDTLQAMGAAPGVNLIYEKDSWSVYSTLAYLININDDVTGSVGGLHLPKIKMNPGGYFEYSVGATKHINEDFNSFLQVTMRNGGRTGVAFTAGLNYKFDAPWTKTKQNKTKETI